MNSWQPSTTSSASTQAPLPPQKDPEYAVAPHAANYKELGSTEAYKLLNRFRNRMASYFPFVVVSQSATLDDLVSERPFLFQAILAVSSRIPTQRTALGNELMKQLATRVVVNGERNMDLLFGTLTYAAW